MAPSNVGMGIGVGMAPIDPKDTGSPPPPATFRIALAAGGGNVLLVSGDNLRRVGS